MSAERPPRQHTGGRPAKRTKTRAAHPLIFITTHGPAQQRLRSSSSPSSYPRRRRVRRFSNKKKPFSRPHIPRTRLAKNGKTIKKNIGTRGRAVAEKSGSSRVRVLRCRARAPRVRTNCTRIRVSVTTSIRSSSCNRLLPRALLWNNVRTIKRFSLSFSFLRPKVVA